MLRYTVPTFDLVQRMQDEVNRRFAGLVQENADANSMTAGTAYPPLNVWEEADAIHVEAELPGIALEDIEILLKGNELSIQGERKVPTGEAQRVHRRERPTGKFSRFVRLPIEVDANKVEAKLVHGVLTLTLPKREEAKPRKIEVKLA